MIIIGLADGKIQDNTKHTVECAAAGDRGGNKEILLVTSEAVTVEKEKKWGCTVLPPLS